MLHSFIRVRFVVFRMTLLIRKEINKHNQCIFEHLERRHSREISLFNNIIRLFRQVIKDNILKSFKLRNSRHIFIVKYQFRHADVLFLRQRKHLVDNITHHVHHNKMLFASHESVLRETKFSFVLLVFLRMIQLYIDHDAHNIAIILEHSILQQFDHFYVAVDVHAFFVRQQQIM